jgi:hypothetical protein
MMDHHQGGEGVTRQVLVGLGPSGGPRQTLGGAGGGASEGAMHSCFPGKYRLVRTVTPLR